MAISEEQKQKIRKLTGFTLDEIFLMKTSEFVLTIGRLQGNKLTKEQYAWLDYYRKTRGHEPTGQLKDVLDVFNLKL